MTDWYLLVCLLCEPRLTIPFLSAEERGKWAAAHRDGTGHDRWQVTEETREGRVGPFLFEKAEL